MLKMRNAIYRTTRRNGGRSSRRPASRGCDPISNNN
jgi:hypothetical protein